MDLMDSKAMLSKSQTKHLLQADIKSKLCATVSANIRKDSNEINTSSERDSFLSESDGKEERSSDTWANRVEFLLAIIGYTVGIGSIWRFPIVCVRNGGAAFLLPFCLILIFIGGPLYYMEINLGQFSGKSPCKAFQLCHLFIGTGYLTFTMLLAILWYYMTIMAWILYYLYSSFSNTLPWTSCENEWNTIYCRDILGRKFNSTITNTSVINDTTIHSNQTTNPALEFWTRHVLRRSEGMENLGLPQLHLMAPLVLAWFITILGIIKGVKSLGKVVYVTALFPYVLLTILLIRGVTLDGSLDGLLYFLHFDTSRLQDYQVWLDASVQVFYSLGPVWGGIITMSSHNKFNQPSFKDTLIVCVTDVCTAFYAALVVFSVIGFMAKEAGVPVGEMATSSGPGLAFVAYPTACSLMPLPQLWAVLFFVMMLLVMLDSAFGLVETVIDSLVDTLPRRLGKHRVSTNICFALVMFLLGIVFTTNGGIYLFQLADWYSSAFALLIGAGLEVTSISLIYGIDRFSADIKMMTGRSLSRLARCLYCVAIPVTSVITFVLMLTKYSAPDYGDGYIYKPYAISIGFILGLAPVVVFIAFAVYVISKQKGSFSQRLAGSLKPSRHWGPQDKKAAELYVSEPYIYEKTMLGRFKKNICGDHDTPWI